MRLWHIAPHWNWLRLVVLLGVVLVILVSLFFGAVPIRLSDLFYDQSQARVIIESLRLPRAILAALVGAVLASSGAVTQGLFRNPLADPSLIGVTAGASAGAGAVIVLLNYMEWSFAGLSLVTLGAFAGGMVAVFLVYKIATRTTGTSVSTMLLAGIAITFIAGSISNIFEFVADNEMLRRITLWRMGGLDAADYSKVTITAMVAIAIWCVLPRYYSALNALLLGESEARHLGIDVDRMKKIVIVCVAAGVGTAVAMAGTISFIGLVVPHVVRMMIGPNHRFLIPLSGFLGAILLVCADAFARTIIAPSEIPVGLVTSIIGAPIFISLLRKRHHYGMQP
ncbi:iron ABC transporter permease [Teredinibacter sp. KSP-S5-2]|uniref:FecCD family ABC transporter permease n=1 Tax=Teredinibacter sp. KSP-S5-2 TaxID=3034506 RepID=UPI0029344963|nr:iron ABC transporter permease [Teredinibacter sp. KSP-S5-2]WNO08374.1 iron ABC transporter permease [Teredinibacter sp. KSP-S5-2]